MLSGGPMSASTTNPCAAFAGMNLIASGSLCDVALAAKQMLETDLNTCILIFDETTGETVEVDFRGAAEDVRRRLENIATNASQSHVESDATTLTDGKQRAVGRPKLGVVAREVTLLPQQWEWLNSQPGGASVTLRKLVEKARLTNTVKDQIRQSQNSAYKFMSAMAGNLPGFEEATRALFAGDEMRFDQQIGSWPEGIKQLAKKLAANALRGAND
jgi:hypothetical protein